MIIESLLIVAFALVLDFSLGDPKNKFHPTAWIGKLIAKLVPFAKNSHREKLAGVLLVLLVSSIVITLLVLLDAGISSIPLDDFVVLFVTVVIGGLLLKTTIAIRGMEQHAIAVVDAVEKNNLDDARTKLSMIVKRNTENLDKNHIMSGVLESVSENTVDGITAPLFYFGLFGIPGSFAYRVINTFDSMIGYKTGLFSNLGWFAANCDQILNYIPARITGLVMILGAMIIGINWKASYQIMRRDCTKTSSPNAGYPMAALAGALGTKFEKIDHYILGDGDIELTKSQIKSAVALMKVTTILFSGLVTIPIIVTLSYLGWWFHA